MDAGSRFSGRTCQSICFRVGVDMWQSLVVNHLTDVLTVKSSIAGETRLDKKSIGENEVS